MCLATLNSSIQNSAYYTLIIKKYETGTGHSGFGGGGLGSNLLPAYPFEIDPLWLVGGGEESWRREGRISGYSELVEGGVVSINLREGQGGVGPGCSELGGGGGGGGNQNWRGSSHCIWNLGGLVGKIPPPPFWLGFVHPCIVSRASHIYIANASVLEWGF